SGPLLVLGRPGSAPGEGRAGDPDESGPAPPRGGEPAQPIDVIEQFRAQRVAVADIHNAYLQLCQARGIELLSLVLFGTIGASVWRREKIAGKVWYMDVVLIPVALAA